MSDRMNPLSFEELMTVMAAEYHADNTIFGQHKFYHAVPGYAWELWGEKAETPFGPAAGPHTQLSQNIIAAYVNGSRFFELKTVQKLDGEDLPVSKPCILAEDEGYNVEWSTELYVEDAFEEYVKAYFALHVLAKELELGSPDGFVFNMSVGYDLEGIKSPKIDRFIEGLKDASTTKIFRDCKQFLAKIINNFRYFKKEDLDAVSPQICRSITLSTLHGCPAGEIEKIASYLLEEKGLNTFIKCNPTLLGYDFARETLNNMGYDYVSFTDFHFNDDLQYADAVPMLKRLLAKATAKGLVFGVKITNTFPVEIKAQELPGEEMYMSGRALYPLSISLAAKLAEEFDGRLPISYSGGADIHNIASIVRSGVWPVTIATTVLKPGGYARMYQISMAFASMDPGTGGIDSGVSGRQLVNPPAVRALAEEAVKSPYHKKSIKVKTRLNRKEAIPALDCFLAPCREGCPIRQDIPAYMELVRRERYEEALELIMTKNPLPFTTGSICPHNCMTNCTRSFYESSVAIRDAKLEAAKRGYEDVFAKLGGVASDPKRNADAKIAVVGGGPAGMAAAYFLAKAGRNVTIFTDTEELGGIPLHVIPEFRISSEIVRRDISFLIKLGVNVSLRKRIETLDELKEFDRILLAVGAGKPGEMKLDGDAYINAITFLKDYKDADGKLSIGKRVAVIGGGNTAMDTARAAIRTEGVEEVNLIYRRNMRYMPADEEELHEAMADGVHFLELLSPAGFAGGILKCEVMKLGEPDASGRRSPVPTGEYRNIPADTVIAAVGERIDGDFYKKMGLNLTEKGLPVVDPLTMEAEVTKADKHVYVIGDGRRGPATVVEAIADAKKCAEHILGLTIGSEAEADTKAEELYDLKGKIFESRGEAACDERCLGCQTLCENCVDVCPNRANVSIRVVGMEKPQVIHMDRLCNECGNCATFCPYEGAPYLEKLTLFDTKGDMDASENNGFCFERTDADRIILRLYDKQYVAENAPDLIPQGVDAKIVRLIEAVRRDYSYLY
ncbi:MAG: putative selenate reductase subunit YgfK [Lachnospiraceae bacterium]|nr:putative selenate reductase subunit YgfK [Lachnospiraceae bacterium]